MNNLNELMKLKNYVNYLIEMVLIEETRAERIKNSDDKMYKDISNDDQKYFTGKTANELNRMRALAASDSKFSGQAITDKIYSKNTLPADAVYRLINKNPEYHNLNKAEEKIKEKYYSTRNEEDKLRGEQLISNSEAKRNHEKNMLIGGSAAIAGLGVAGYAAYKLAKKKKIEKEKSKNK